MRLLKFATLAILTFPITSAFGRAEPLFTNLAGSVVTGLAAAPGGGMYALSWGFPKAEFRVLHVSTDFSTSKELDVFTFSDPQRKMASFSGSVDDQGNFIYAGWNWVTSGTNRWIVRRVTMTGQGTTLEELPKSPGDQAVAYDIQSSEGQLYASGWTKISGQTYLLIRSSSDSGATWKDSFREPVEDGDIYSLIPRPDGLIAAGNRVVNGVRRLRVVETKDKGTTWQDLPDGIFPQCPLGIRGWRANADDLNNVYIAGFCRTRPENVADRMALLAKYDRAQQKWTLLDTFTPDVHINYGYQVHIDGKTIYWNGFNDEEKGVPPYGFIRASRDQGQTWYTYVVYRGDGSGALMHPLIFIGDWLYWAGGLKSALGTWSAFAMKLRKF